jgi:hypothetical protein
LASGSVLSQVLNWFKAVVPVWLTNLKGELQFS